jgi:hypothetical protein
MISLTNIILFFILVCLYFISNIIWEIYVKKIGHDEGFFKNLGVSLIYCLVAVSIIYILVIFLQK